MIRFDSTLNIIPPTQQPFVILLWSKMHRNGDKNSFCVVLLKLNDCVVHADVPLSADETEKIEGGPNAKAAPYELKVCLVM